MRSAVTGEAVRGRRGADRGVSVIEYAGTIVLAAGLFAALWAVGIGPAVARALPPALCTLLQSQQRCAGAPKAAAGSPRPRGNPSGNQSQQPEPDVQNPARTVGDPFDEGPSGIMDLIPHILGGGPRDYFEALASSVRLTPPDPTKLSKQAYFNAVVDQETSIISAMARNGGKLGSDDYSDDPHVQAYTNGVKWAMRDASRRQVDPSATEIDHAGQVAVRNYMTKNDSSWIGPAWDDAHS